MRTTWIWMCGLAVLGVLSIVGAAATRGNPPVLAVFDIEDRTGDLDARALDQLTDYLATRLGEGGHFRVVPRDAVHKRLRKSKRKTYKKCYDTACQVDMGRELAAGKIVSARVLRIGTDCRLTLHLYDLARAATDATTSIKTSCGIDALPDAIDKAVARIGGTPGASAPKPSDCPDGQIDIAGNCCWPGQDWGVTRQECVGVPRCPNGFLPKGNGCKRGCARGRVDIAGHCCWPGQDWGANTGRCLGSPECPRGFKPQENDCVLLTADEIGERCEELLRLPCLRECYNELPDNAYMKRCMQDKVVRCVDTGARPLDCGADVDGCVRWCKKNARHKKYCESSCRDSYEREQEKCRLVVREACAKDCPRCERPATR